jgi:integrase
VQAIRLCWGWGIGAVGLPQHVNQRYRRLAIKLGLRSTRLHGLRDYSATALLSAGVDLRTVAGHLATAAAPR